MKTSQGRSKFSIQEHQTKRQLWANDQVSSFSNLELGKCLVVGVLVSIINPILPKVTIASTSGFSFQNRRQWEVCTTSTVKIRFFRPETCQRHALSGKSFVPERVHELTSFTTKHLLKGTRWWFVGKHILWNDSENRKWTTWIFSKNNLIQKQDHQAFCFLLFIIILVSCGKHQASDHSVKTWKAHASNVTNKIPSWNHRKL